MSIQTLELDENLMEFKEVGFLERQFQTESTFSRNKFDWLFGVILPVVCFVFDPTVFKGGVFGAAILAPYKPFAYILSFVSVMALSAWLIWGAKLKWLNAFLAGLFAVSGIVSLGIGIVILPYSLMGLIVLVGILGFTPFFSSVVFLRNALRAYQAAKPFFEKRVLVNSFALSAIFCATIPFVINAQIRRTLDEMTKGDAETVRVNARSIRYVAPLVNSDVLALHFHRSAADERKTEKMQAIAEVYKQMTGEDIEKRARVLMD